MKIELRDRVRMQERLHSTDPFPLDDLQQLIVTFDTRRRFLLTLQSTVLGRKVVPAPGQRLTRHEEDANRACDADALALARGISQYQAITNPEVGAEFGQPGINECERVLERLRHRLEQEELRETLSWPRPFKYTGRQFKAQIDGRYLEPGDVVNLTEAQSIAFADRFEPVVENSELRVLDAQPS